MRVTPARAAIAATVLVVALLTLTRDRVARDSFSRAAAVRPVAGTMNSAAARDPLLASAIRRNIAEAVPPRTLRRGAGVDVPTADAPSRPASVDESAAVRVARGRTMERAAAQAAPASSDALAASNAAAAAPTVMKSASGPTALGSTACLRIDRATTSDAWPGVALPLTLTLGDGGMARMIPADGLASLTGRWRTVGDSAVAELPGAQRLALASAPGERRGILASPTASVRVVANPVNCSNH